MSARLRELAVVFLKLGTIGFGGPAAHIAMMEHEVVRRRAWMTRDELLELIAICHLLPGPTSTELAIHIGHRRAGWRGLVVAGLCFILPAVAIVSAIAWAYVRYGTLPEAGALLAGVKPVMVAVVVHALVGFGRTALPTFPRLLAAAAAATAVLLGVHELAVLATIGLVFAFARLRASPPAPSSGPRAAPLLWFAPAPALAADPTVLRVFLVFLKIGSILFGSGYVLVAFLRTELVERLHWLTEAQLLDAVAVGQITPGPVFTTATFVGYLVAGPAGAAAATVGIFLPAFLLVAAAEPIVRALRRSAAAGAFLTGVTVASLGLMAAVTVPLADAALVDLLTLLLAATSLALLLFTRLSPTWLILLGATVGLARMFLG